MEIWSPSPSAPSEFPLRLCVTDWLVSASVEFDGSGDIVLSRERTGYQLSGMNAMQLAFNVFLHRIIGET